MKNHLKFIFSFCIFTSAHADVAFKKISLSKDYTSEGVSVSDLNADNHLDIIAGSVWWQGPDFKTSHAYAPYEVFPIKGPGLQGYSNNFFTFSALITQDKWPDLLKIGLPSSPAELVINPGKNTLPENSKKHDFQQSIAQENICNESPQYLKILPGDQKQLLAYSDNHITISHPATDPSKHWIVFNVSPPHKRFKTYTHGLGATDINGDKLPDILEKAGWWEQPKDWDRTTPWKFHPYNFAPGEGGAQMYGYDIDGDGDTDVVTALNAHGYGLAWYEQTKIHQNDISFKQHIIMPTTTPKVSSILSFSQPHAMACVDIDGDGIKDIVTGKCYFAHGGKDPGAHDPAVIYWFKATRSEKGVTFTPHLIDNNAGIGRQITTADLNKDGKIDLAVSNKKGTHIFIQQ